MATDLEGLYYPNDAIKASIAHGGNKVFEQLLKPEINLLLILIAFEHLSQALCPGFQDYSE